MIQAVLFDMDGVLLDSEIWAKKSINRAAQKQGFSIPDDIVTKTTGMSFVGASKYYKMLNPNVDVAQMKQDFFFFQTQCAKEGQMQLKKGVHALLKLLDEKKIVRSIVSSSSVHAIQEYMDCFDLKDRFDDFVGGDMGTLSKPHPDIYLLGAERLQVAPQNCLVIEDSKNGVMAGRRAGMQVVMIPDLIPYEEAFAPYCDHVLSCLTEVGGIL